MLCTRRMTALARRVTAFLELRMEQEAAAVEAAAQLQQYEEQMRYGDLRHEEPHEERDEEPAQRAAVTPTGGAGPHTGREAAEQLSPGELRSRTIQTVLISLTVVHKRASISPRRRTTHGSGAPVSVSMSVRTPTSTAAWKCGLHTLSCSAA